MATRATSWRDVPAINPRNQVRFVPGGLGAWRGVVPAGSTSRSSKGRGKGRQGQPNDLERLVAAESLKDKGDGFNPFNAGGKLLIGALDALDTPRAAVLSGLKEVGDVVAPTYGEEASFGDFAEQTRRNITAGEVLFGDPDFGPGVTIPGVGMEIGAGFAADVALDPLTYLTGGAARVGVEAGQPAARKLLSQPVREAFGEAAVEAAERGGATFRTPAARARMVEELGGQEAARQAQIAVKYKTNQLLSPAAREAIGAEPGTFVKIPGSKRLGVDKLIEKIAPQRVYDAQRGGKALKVTRREAGVGKLLGRTRARVTQGKIGNSVAQHFTKYPEMRSKILFGEPKEAAEAFLGLGARSAGDLQRRLKDVEWGTQLSHMLDRSKKAHISGEDLRYAMAESLEGVAGPSSAKIMAAAAKRGDDTLFDDWREFFPKIRDDANSIDPDLPWLQDVDNYSPRLPSDEMIAFRGGYGNAGGALKRDVFDHKRTYDWAPGEGKKTELFGVELKNPDEVGKSVDQQIDDILADKGVPNWFEKDAYKAFPDYVRRLARRYGDEFMAKQLRDLGIIEPGLLLKLTEQGVKQGKINAALYSMMTRAQIRADRKALLAKQANEVADSGIPDVQRGREFVKKAQEGREALQREADDLTAMAGALDPSSIREYEAQLRVDAEVLATRRQGLMDQIDIAQDELFGLEHAQVELSHKVALDTWRSTERVTRLEAKVAQAKEELGELLEKARSLKHYDTLPERTAADALKALKRVEERTTEVMQQIRDGEIVLHQFEDLAARPTDALEAQLAQVDRSLKYWMTSEDVQLNDHDLTNKIQVLANVKSSILHEKGVIERARERVAELDRTAPSLVAELDVLHSAEAMGDKVIHTLFPDLPPEIHGSRVRDYFDSRQRELQSFVDKTKNQVLSAYADGGTMRVELSQIRQQRRIAERNLKAVKANVSEQERILWGQEADLLEQADAAMERAIEIEDEIGDARERINELNDEIAQGVLAEKIAENYLNVMHARQLRYEADALHAERTASEARKTADFWQNLHKTKWTDDLDQALTSALHDNYKAIGAVSMTDKQWLVDGLRAATIMTPPNGLKPALRLYDRALNLWKAYALSTPGTVLRNLFGGVFNNHLAGNVQVEDYSKTLSWLHAGGKGLNAEDRAILQEISDAGLLTGSATTLEIERRLGTGTWNPASTDFHWTQFFRRRQENVESYVRGALAYRTIKDGGTIDDAIGQVMRFHFDYDDLSAMERSFMRRVVPFYTWSRKNFPLMLEQLVKNPTNFSRFYQLKNEVEYYSPEESLVPSYFAENLAIRLPFGLGEGRGYMLPDLPFTSLNDVTDPTIAMSQVSPFIKTPVEYVFGKQFFKGIPLRDEYQPVPGPMAAIPGVLPALGAMGLAERTEQGWMMKQKDLYVAEAMLPVFGRTRRLFPSEEQFDDKVLSTWLSFGFGLGLRSNTPQDRRNEAYRRVDRQLDRIETWEELGRIPEGQKLPRPGQTISAAYELAGVPKR